MSGDALSAFRDVPREMRVSLLLEMLSGLNRQMGWAMEQLHMEGIDGAAYCIREMQEEVDAADDTDDGEAA